MDAKIAAVLRLLKEVASASSFQTSAQTSFENSPKSLYWLAIDADADIVKQVLPNSGFSAWFVWRNLLLFKLRLSEAEECL